MSRDQLLEEMGLGPIWKLRSYRGALHAGQTAPETKPAPSAATAVSATAMPERASATPSAPSRPVPPSPALHSAMPAEWSALNAEIAACRACGLCEGRQQTVPGCGAPRPDYLLIGEAPGAEEDASGQPFVGPAGKLLDAMLAAIGLSREDHDAPSTAASPGVPQHRIFVTNAVKCRPPERAPQAAELAACKPYLLRQIALLQPRVIVLFGRAAAHAVLGSDEALSSLRSTQHQCGDIPVLVTYHPAYLLRAPTDKAKAWEDLCAMRRLMRSLHA